MMLSLYDAAPQAGDPLAMLIAAGSAALTTLLGIVLALVNHRATTLEDSVKAQGQTINGLSTQNAELRGEIKELRSELKATDRTVDALSKNTLTRDVFDARQNAQDEKLDRVETRVERIDRGLATRPTRSEISLPAARPVPREEPPSDPPVPPRPRLPSRGRFGAE